MTIESITRKALASRPAHIADVETFVVGYVNGYLDGLPDGYTMIIDGIKRTITDARQEAITLLASIQNMGKDKTT